MPVSSSPEIQAYDEPIHDVPEDSIPVESSNNVQEAPFTGVTEVSTQKDIEVEEAPLLNVPEVPIQQDTKESEDDFILQKTSLLGGR